MVKQQKKHSKKKRSSKGFNTNAAEARRINASTVYDTCTEQLRPFGGLLAVINFLDLLKLKEIFDSTYQAPSRKPKMGHYLMVVGILMLLFIGFNRVWHFTYVRLDAIICGFFRLTRLPVATTFWRYVDSLGLNQANSFLKIMSILRERFWQVCGLCHDRINISIDTTVETIYGNQQGGRKGHNKKNRGKKGYVRLVTSQSARDMTLLVIVYALAQLTLHAIDDFPAAPALSPMNIISVVSCTFCGLHRALFCRLNSPAASR